MYAIDGLFLAQKITGIQRYAIEICRELDKIVEKGEIEIVVPAYLDEIPDYRNLKVVRYGERQGRAWEQADLMSYLRRNGREGIFLTNEVPLLYPKGIACIHDISYKVNPSFFTSVNKKLSRLWHCINYSFITRNCRKILTVSEFSKSEIMRVYHVDENRITVINNAWQHMADVDADESVFEKYPFLYEKEFYFSMSTLAPNKNFKWILSAARQNPESVFAIAGGGRLKDFADESGYADLKNVYFLGYVSDEEAKALMKHCKAFLFPTLYEGFGIPPMEAAVCGCKNVVVSDIPCMHEIYGDSVTYIDPNNYESINLKDLQFDKDAQTVLDRYSWKDSARKFLNVIRDR